MELIDAFAYRVRTTGPLKTTKGSPAGERSYWIVSEAQLAPTSRRSSPHLAAIGCGSMMMAFGGPMFAHHSRPTMARRS
jgi:hypothetical protein